MLMCHSILIERARSWQKNQIIEEEKINFRKFAFFGKTIAKCTKCHDRPQIHCKFLPTKDQDQGSGSTVKDHDQDMSMITGPPGKGSNRQDFFGGVNMLVETRLFTWIIYWIILKYISICSEIFGQHIPGRLR